MFPLWFNFLVFVRSLYILNLSILCILCIIVKAKKKKKRKIGISKSSEKKNSLGKKEKKNRPQKSKIYQDLSITWEEPGNEAKKIAQI